MSHLYALEAEETFQTYKALQVLNTYFHALLSQH